MMNQCNMPEMDLCARNNRNMYLHQGNWRLTDRPTDRPTIGVNHILDLQKFCMCFSSHRMCVFRSLPLSGRSFFSSSPCMRTVCITTIKDFENDEPREDIKTWIMGNKEWISGAFYILRIVLHYSQVISPSFHDVTGFPLWFHSWVVFEATWGSTGVMTCGSDLMNNLLNEWTTVPGGLSISRFNSVVNWTVSGQCKSGKNEFVWFILLISPLAMSTLNRMRFHHDKM